MNRLFRFLVLGLSLLFCFVANAQPSILLTETEVQEGEEFEVVLSIKDVTDISEINLTLNWDTTYLEFNNTNGITKNGVDIKGLRDQSFISREKGVIGMEWDITDLAGLPDQAITLPGNDWYWVFKASFTAKTVGQTQFSIGDTPIPFLINRFQGDKYTAIQTRDSIFGGNINILPSTAGMVSPPPPPVTSAEDLLFSLTPDKDIACIDDRICYSVAVENFDSIISFNFPLNWDQTILEYDRVENFNLENFIAGNIGGTPSDGFIRVTYTGDINDPVHITNGANVPDGTAIFDLCFNVIGASNNQQSIFVGQESSDLFSTEAVDKDEQVIAVQFETTPIETYDCDQTILLNTACNNGTLGEQVCVDIQPIVFQNVGGALFSLSWDQSILDFSTLSNPNPALAGLQENIDPATGDLSIEWNAETNAPTGATLTANDAPIATVCFDINANATIGSSIPISYSSNTFFDIDGNLIDGTVQLEGCAIEVTEPPLPEPILSAASDLEVAEGAEICVDILVDDFTGITSFEFPVLWDKDILEFQEVRSEAFSDIIVNSNNAASDGEILVNWGSAARSPESLPREAVLLTVCFRAIGTEGKNSGIVFTKSTTEQPFSIGGVPLESSTENGLVTITPSTDNPVTFSTVPMDNLARNKSVCIPVTVNNFKDIISADILVKWDSTILQLDSLSNIKLSGIDNGGLNINKDILGQLAVSSFDNANFGPLSLDDNSVVFELCFTTIGDIGACTEIEFPSSLGAKLAEIVNDPISGNNIGIVGNGSQVCLTSFGIDESSFNPQNPTCDSDGSLNATIIGGEDGYTYFWTINDTAEPQRASDAATINRQLSAQVDSVCLTVYSPNVDQSDTQCKAITLNDTRIPDVFADIDMRDTIDVGCGNTDLLETQLRGDFIDPQEASGGGNGSDVVNFKWTAINGGEIKAFSERGPEATAVGLGTYIFTVTNPSGCSGSDTLEIVSSTLPTLSIAKDNEELTCNVSQVALTGTSSEIGDEWEYNWINNEGDTLTGADPFELVVEQGGRYSFLINNTINGCNSSEAVIVNENTPIVNADAGNATETLKCGEFVRLDGSASDTGGNFKTEWISENSFSTNNNLSLVIDVTKAGTYILEITDNPTGCVGRDTVQVFADPELPVAKTRAEAFIGCDQTETIIRSIPVSNSDLNGTSVGAKFNYRWETIGGDTISEIDTARVFSTGEYLFIVVNSENDACAADTARVQVVENTTKPVATFSNSATIGCTEDCIDLTPEIGAIGDAFTNDDLAFSWTTDVGTFCGDANSMTAQTNQTGTYFFIITNTANNCVDTARINVFPDPDNGIIAEAGPARELTCTSDSVSIGSDASSIGEGITYEWRFEEEEEIISEELLFTVTKAGRYRLTVIDEEGGCRGSGSVEVTENKEFPIADAGSNFPLVDCVVDPFKLNALNSDSGNDISYQWTTTDGEIVSGETTLTPTVSQIGTYSLEVLNEESGCSSTSEVVVSSEVFSPAAIVEETERSLDCNDNTIVLDASSSFTDDGTNTATIEWTTNDGNIISGAATKMLVVDSAGTYTLTLTADNGCEDKATVVVTNNARLPEVDAGEGFRITCNEQMTIDASNSSSYENLVIQWTTNDGSIVSGANTLMPEINLGGTYTLIITDTTNNCRVEDAVIINSDGILPVAQAGDNIEVCGRDAILSASPVTDGITGIWTALNGGQVDANDPMSNVANLSAGENRFVWTLSSDDCTDFSSDTVTVNALTLPVAVADDFEYIVGQGTVELDLVGNDQPNTDNFAINIIREPASAILNKVVEGVYSIDLPSRPTRQDFQYEICSATCADVCADATVRLVVRPEALDSLEVNPNAITPNGDGLNDLLIFDELYIEDYPQSELVVFNRWGDVIYKVSPYNNDWQGEGSDGTIIPEGTYYYILRLDISEGEIIRGDVTIMR